jgi:peptidoglycan/xylan/chitin deacetylase (PgdA/CDA1 family)
MKKLLLFAFLCFSSLLSAQQKKVCITIDDLPAITNGIEGNEIRQEITNGIVKTLKAYDAKAIGYVNVGKLYDKGQFDSARLEMLATWLQSGQELGNHTFNHPSYHRINFAQYTKAITREESVLKDLAKAYGSEIKYFRHPYLHIGLNQAKADSLRSFLVENGYTEAPVTIDNDEYLFAAAYTKAYRNGEEEQMEKIASDYLNYMEEKLIYYEELSVKFYGRPINQTLLIHANLLNSRYLDELLDIFLKHDYAFASQEEILKDPVYNQPVTVYGEYGISWIKRWGLSSGRSVKKVVEGDPQVPDYINN